MKKLLMLSAFASFALVVCAEDAAPARRKMSKEEARQKAAEIIMKRTGGRVRKSGSAVGSVAFLNAQKKVQSEDLKGAWLSIEKMTHYQIVARDVESVSHKNPNKDILAVGAKVGVVIVNDSELPALLTAPESGWAMVNVAALASDSPEPDKLASRVRKEILRGFGLMGGAAFMSAGPIVLCHDVAGPRDLDKIKIERLGEEALAACERGLAAQGVTPWLETTYVVACQQGWAPAPTNEHQKAIWDKVHAPPSKPMKITYDKDKQKPVVK